MRVLIDAGHPAHIHLFRNFSREMILRRHEILFTCREKEFETDLLSHYNLPYVSFGRKPKFLIGKLAGLLIFDIKMISVSLHFKPDLFLSHGSQYAAHASFFTRKQHIALEDTFNFEQIWMYKPFTRAILTGNFDHPMKSEKVIKYDGYHEIAYLHPSRFTPDRSVLDELGVGKNEKYVIIRFVSWGASHDIGHTGLSHENKIKAVREFSKAAKVFISSESDLPPELARFRLKIAPHRIHDAMAFATFIWSEGFTMPSECSVLGTPSIVIHNSLSFPLNDQSNKYGLCFLFSESKEDQVRAIQKGIELLNTPGLKEQWILKRDKMLSEKIDLTGFLVWFVENWPESMRTMKQNPEYQKVFIKNMN